MAEYPAGSRKIDRALTDMWEHLEWLREHRTKQEHDSQQYRLDLMREVGLTEAMEILRDRYQARTLAADVAAGLHDQPHP